MATVTTQSPDLTRGGAYVGFQHYAIHYSSVDAEVLTPGMDGIVHAAFQPDEAGDIVVVIPASATTITAVAVGGPHSGTLHVWARA